MRPRLAELLVCPDCRGALALQATRTVGEAVVSGLLRCVACAHDWPIVRGIPRFVTPEEDYCESFGWQWDRFRLAQIDEFSGTTESEDRFRSETTWTPQELSGRLVLDAGCGAGRFTAVAARWGARVVSVDLASAAIEACDRTVRELGYEADLVQASLFRLPFRPATFARVFSLGVIQHTPDPGRVMRLLPKLVEPRGRLAYWIYEQRWTNYLMVRNALRLLTPRLSIRSNYGLSTGLVSLFFPLSLALSRVPGLRRTLPLLPIASRHRPGLTLRQQWDWTLLDTFDWYSPAYEFRQSEEAVVRALQEAGMVDIERTPAGGMAIVGRMP